MIDQRELTHELARLMADKHTRDAKYDADRRRARQLRREVTAQLRQATKHLNQFGWPKEATLERVDIMAPVKSVREQKLLLLTGEGLRLPLGEIPQTGIYLGEDGSLYQVNYLMWSDPSLKLIPFWRMELGHAGADELESILAALHGILDP